MNYSNCNEKKENKIGIFIFNEFSSAVVDKRSRKFSICLSIIFNAMNLYLLVNLKAAVSE